MEQERGFRIGFGWMSRVLLLQVARRQAEAIERLDAELRAAERDLEYERREAARLRDSLLR
jgi:hypothetical protein